MEKSSRHVLVRQAVCRLIDTYEAPDPQTQLHTFWRRSQFAGNFFALECRKLRRSLLATMITELTVFTPEPIQRQMPLHNA